MNRRWTDNKEAANKKAGVVIQLMIIRSEDDLQTWTSAKGRKATFNKFKNLTSHGK